MHTLPRNEWHGKMSKRVHSELHRFPRQMFVTNRPFGARASPLPRNEWHGVLRVQDVNGYMCSKKHEKSGKLKGLFIIDFITKQ